MSPYSYYRFDHHDEQLSPILEDNKGGSSPSTGIMWKYMVAGLALGLASYSFGHVMSHWIIAKFIPSDIAIDSRTLAVFDCATGGIVVLSNATFLCKLFCGKPKSSDVDPFFSCMIGIFLAWLIMNLAWYHVFDFTTISLIAMYAFVYRRFQQQSERDGTYRDCPIV